MAIRINASPKTANGNVGYRKVNNSDKEFEFDKVKIFFYLSTGNDCLDAYLDFSLLDN